MSTTSMAPGSARERLLSAASELFYEEGVRTVGIDRVIERAGVAKATLYSTFGSKEGLIEAYLDLRHQQQRERMTRGLARFDNDRDRLLGVFDVLGEWIARPEFNGCAYVNASAESPAGGVVEHTSDQARAWRKALLAELAEAAGVRAPKELAEQFSLLYDGATIAARMDRNPQAHLAARAMAVVLLDAAG